MSKKILVRLGVSDIILTKEENERTPEYIEIKDKDGNVVGEVETYLIGYEDEDGNECDEDGEEL